MNVNNNVAFTARTKKGNEYDKTNVGKYVGGTIGAGYITGFILKNKEAVKKIQDDVLVNEYSKILKNPKFDKKIVINKLKPFIEKNAKLIKASGLALVITAFTATGVTIGAIVDKVINHNKAKNADKEVYLK